MNDRFELASAYLDGELSPDERALVDVDDELLAVVAQLRRVAAEVGEVEPPTPLTRELALSAALAAADDLRHGTEPVDRSSVEDQPRDVTVVALPSRDRRFVQQRVLAVAAAVLAIGVVGVVAATGLRGAGDDDAATGPIDETAELLVDDDDADMSDERRSSDDADTFASESFDAESIDAESIDGGDDGDVSAEMAAEPAATEDAEAGATLEEDAPPLTTAPAHDSTRLDVSGLEGDELVELAVAIREALLDEERDPAASPCAELLSEALAPATRSGRDATLGIDGDLVVVLATDDCALLTSAPLERAAG